MLMAFANFDHSIFYSIYNFSGRSQFLDALIIFCGEYLIYLVMLFVFWHAYRMWQKHDRQTVALYIEALIAVILGNGIFITLIRHFYHRIRPFSALALSNNLLIDPAYSFPSGHAIFMFALATSVYFYDRKFGWFLYICGALIGLGRIAGGVHYPSDIFAGAIFGIALGTVVYQISRKILPKYVRM